MTRLTVRYALLCSLLLAASGLYAQGTFVKTNSGIIVSIKNEPHKLVKLDVVNENIIHVTASPVSVLKKDTSLYLVKQTLKPAFTISSSAKQVVLATNKMKAVVDLSDGEVKFLKANGEPILQEHTNGRTFTPVTIDAGKSFAVKQVFDSDPQESFYGLGQHQQAVMNYKGDVIDLWQNNTEVAIPFLVSGKSYGILWDNCSISQFGDGRNWQSLKDLTLTNDDGNSSGLTATYAYKNDPLKPFVTRNENEIDYDYLYSLKNLPSSYSLADGVITWSGTIQSAYSGLHTFSVKYGGYIKVWINGKLLLDRWRQCWNPATALIPTDMKAGEKYSIKIQWTPDGEESFVKVLWLPPATNEEQHQFQFSSEAGDVISYYVVSGQSMDDVIAGYRFLTGKAPIVPKWAMGLWQSRERYKTQEEILSVVKSFREKNIPLDNIVMDWQYWKPDEWGSQQFDPSRFPDPKAMIDSLHKVYHTHFMISVWPKFYEGIPNYNTFNKNGWLYTQNVKNRQKDWLGYISTFYDAYNPVASKAFWNLLQSHLYSKGIDAWWMDASEPDIYSNISPDQRKLLMYPNALGSATKYMNAYPMFNAKPIYEGQRAADQSKRVFILTRSAFAGSQRYAAAVWSGDIAARWSDMKSQISAGVNFSMSGIPYWSMDIGGFAVEHRFENEPGKLSDEWKEQFTRWYQFGAFVPLFRVHGQYPYREIFNTASPSDTAYQSMLYYDRLRYKLMPYLYSLAGLTYWKDYTIMRGLVMDFGSDKKIGNINDEFMLGPSLLVSPVCNYKERAREIYLPADNNWYDLYSGEMKNGGETISAKAPYDRIPVFVKEGSIIPFGPELEYTGEKKADTITLYVYTGKDARFTLYEDEGTNYNYEKGQYATIDFTYNEGSKSLLIEKRKGNFPGMLQTRVFNIVWINDKAQKGIDTNPVTDQTVNYKGEKVIVKFNN